MAINHWPQISAIQEATILFGAKKLVYECCKNAESVIMAPKFLVSYPTIGRHRVTSVGSRFVLKRFVSKEIEFRSILLNKNSFAKFKSIHRLVLSKEDEMLRKYWSSSFLDLVNQKSTTSKKINLRVPRL